MILIGIDPGVNTGLAVWDAERFAWFDRVKRPTQTCGIIDAFEIVKAVSLHAQRVGDSCFVIVEDARKRSWFDNRDENQKKYGAGVREGVGSIKRDSSIWEEFLQFQRIPYELRRPSSTKMQPEVFARLTGITARTSEHARDAAMIVFQVNRSMALLKLKQFQARLDDHDDRKGTTK